MRRTRRALAGMFIAGAAGHAVFASQVALVAFGWWYLLWSLPMLGLLLWVDRDARARGAG